MRAQHAAGMAREPQGTKAELPLCAGKERRGHTIFRGTQTELDPALFDLEQVEQPAVIRTQEHRAEVALPVQLVLQLRQ